VREGEVQGCTGEGEKGEAEHGFDFIGLTGRGRDDGRVGRPSMAMAGAGGFDEN
jgi:hypothetical protein